MKQTDNGTALITVFFFTKLMLLIQACHNIIHSILGASLVKFAATNRVKMVPSDTK